MCVRKCVVHARMNEQEGPESMREIEYERGTLEGEPPRTSLFCCGVEHDVIDQAVSGDHWRGHHDVPLGDVLWQGIPEGGERRGRGRKGG
jgi:hypothetical protein